MLLRSAVIMPLFVSLLGGGSVSCVAAEAGQSHYWPGSIASVIDRASPSESLVINVSTRRHEGRVSHNGTPVPLGRFLATDVDIESEMLAVAVNWNPGREIAEDWMYSAGMKIPYISQQVTATIGSGNSGVRKSDKDSGAGDILLSPLMLSYAVNRTWWGDVRFNIYAPTGRYDAESLANTGTNYWTFEPIVGLVHIEPAVGREFSLFSGMAVNTRNTDTDYHTGAQFHLASTYVQYAILLGGFTGIGVSGYLFRQLSGDSGSGASAGDFKSHGVGLGPVLSYRSWWGGAAIMAELKCFYSVENTRSPDGNHFSLKFSMTY
ncbi:SphA family protein [Photobacterium sp. J15]|uniref:SphA family protein n=1 Tax=Photobacterium sp. J15 TaxID=265901 RepID=UPI000A7CF2B5|nr:transporter [Photobacterium sp. J15]